MTMEKVWSNDSRVFAGKFYTSMDLSWCLLLLSPNNFEVEPLCTPQEGSKVREGSTFLNGFNFAYNWPMVFVLASLENP